MTARTARGQPEPHLRRSRVLRRVLTVTDNDGATDSVTHSVTTVAPTGPIAQDAFVRTATNGWGNADTGGAWTRYGTASLFSVGSGTGQIRMAVAGAGPRIALESVSSVSTEGFVKVALDKIPDGGGGFVSLGVRTIGTTDYRAKVKVASNGVLTLYLVKVINGTETHSDVHLTRSGLQLLGRVHPADPGPGDRGFADHRPGEGLEDHPNRAEHLAADHHRQQRRPADRRRRGSGDLPLGHLDEHPDHGVVRRPTWSRCPRS